MRLAVRRKLSVAAVIGFSTMSLALSDDNARCKSQLTQAATILLQAQRTHFSSRCKFLLPVEGLPLPLLCERHH